ncbi:hypothetical protein ACFL5V_07645 [Fibrobacterota bacterium]
MIIKVVSSVAAAALFLSLTSCTDKPTTPEDETRYYVGSRTCMDCKQHEEKAALFQKTGHAHALKKIEAGAPPVYPFTYEEASTANREPSQKHTAGAYYNLAAPPLCASVDQCFLCYRGIQVVRPVPEQQWVSPERAAVQLPAL